MRGHIKKILETKPPSSITDTKVIKYPIKYIGGFTTVGNGMR